MRGFLLGKLKTAGLLFLVLVVVSGKIIQMKTVKLFMMLLGCKPPGRNTEQHDIFFTFAESISATEADVRNFWPEAPKIHLDAWREVFLVDGQKVSVVPKGTAIPSKYKLFFINLGGYKPGEFDEFHYKMLVVAENIAEAQKLAKQTVFFLHTKAPGAPAHIDDKYGVDVDDTHEVKDIIPEYLKEQYEIQLEDVLFDIEQKDDAVHLGYQLYEKMN